MPTMQVTVELLRDHIAVGRQEQAGVLPLDRPEQTGGTGLGFNGGHLMLLGWGACFKSTLVAAAEARGIAVRGLRLSIRGVTADQPFRFERIEMDIDLDAEASEEDRQKLITIARNGCAVSNTLARGTELQTTLTATAG